jgi:hypothetical protein
LVKRKPYEAEVTLLDREKREWRYPVDLQNMTCSCRQWQITGLPCIHALFFITSLHGPATEIDQYVHECYSVAKFKATYAVNVPSMVGKQQWDIVNLGFVLHTPVQGRAPERPRKTKIRSSAEGTGLGLRKRKCKRCGGLGDITRNCKNIVDPAFGEDHHWGVKNALQTLPEPFTVTSEEVAFGEDEHWGAENTQELVEPSTVVVLPLAEPSNVAQARYYSFLCLLYCDM